MNSLSPIYQSINPLVRINFKILWTLDDGWRAMRGSKQTQQSYLTLVYRQQPPPSCPQNARRVEILLGLNIYRI